MGRVYSCRPVGLGIGVYPHYRGAAVARKTKKKKSPVRRSREAISATKARTDAALTAAAQTVASDPPADTNGEAPQPERIQGTPDQRQEAQQRAAECSRALDEVLQRFRCRIVPVLDRKSVV